MIELTMLLLGQTANDQPGLTIGGMIIMVCSIGLVLALSGFCMVKILGEQKPTEHHHAPLDIDTHDLDP
ncbi:MAG: hypothetical protein IID43_01515 [Planctomycetes bacterium]|nr:hypothetical protein [Planctomycetota bacterium]